MWNKSINFKVYKVDYTYDKNTYKTTSEETLLFEKTLSTNSSWLASLDYKINDYWEFRFEIETADQKYKTTKTYYVSGYNIIKPTEQEHNISLVNNKDIYEVWDTAEFIISSPVIWVKALVTVEKLNKVLPEVVVHQRNR